MTEVHTARAIIDYHTRTEALRELAEEAEDLGI